MLSNKIFLLKLITTLLLIISSFYFFSSGYYQLQKINLVNKSYNNKIVNKNKTSNYNNKSIENNENIEIFRKDKSLKISNIIPEKIDEEIIIIVKKGDIFSKLIDPFIKNKNQKQKVITLINNEYDLKSLKINQKIFLYKGNNNQISKIIIPVDFNIDLIVSKDLDGNYFIKKQDLPIYNQFGSIKFQIKKSLFEDGKKAGIPLPILVKIIQLYSFDIDFQRDIKKGNELEVLYESFYNEKRETKSFGKIYYVNLFLDKNELEYFLFKTNEGFYDYFNNNGKNVKKALMKTPIDGAKLSSSFGMRKHPILGYNKLHKGTDFAAPNGTPIYAAGNGIIEVLGTNGKYGRYIRIRHNNSYKTAYAHLSRYNKKLSKGIRVNQGDIIGYVGTTGSSTGPHLHYEIIYKNKQINPKSLNLPSGKVLNGDELLLFKKEARNIYSNFLFTLYE